MKCDEVAEQLPALLDAGGTASLEVRQHIEGCLRCQADLVRYRRMLRELREMRTRFLEPSPDALSQTLAALWEAGERRAIRSMVTGRRLAYARLCRRGRGHRHDRGRGRRAAHAAQPQARTLRGQRGRRGLAEGLGRPPDILTRFRRSASGHRHRTEGSSSTGRAPVSKTGGWGFESLLPCARSPR
jgi:hypothetical protein